MEYLRPEDMLQIHSFIIDETGGSHGVRDTGLIQSAAQAPKQSFGGEDAYPDVFKKAAVYLHRIIMNHPFVDGNKRTAITAATIFLEQNGYRFTAPEGELENFALKVVEDKLDIDQIADWLEQNARLGN